MRRQTTRGLPAPATRAWLAVVALLGAAGCEEVAAPRPTAVELSSDRSTAAVSDSIRFRYEAQGRSLAGLTVDFGDGAIESVAGHGAQTAAGTLRHAFETGGTYDVAATVLDSTGETASDTVTVVITGPAEDH